MLSASKMLSTASRLCRRFQSKAGERPRDDSLRVQSLSNLGLFLPDNKVLTCGEQNFYLAYLLGRVTGRPSMVMATSPDPPETYVNTKTNITERKNLWKEERKEFEEEWKVIKKELEEKWELGKKKGDEGKIDDKFIETITKFSIDPHKLSIHIENRDLHLPKGGFNSILYHMPQLPSTHKHRWAKWKPSMDPLVCQSYLNAMIEFINSTTRILNGKGHIILFDDAKGPQNHWKFEKLIEKSKELYDSGLCTLVWGDQKEGELVWFRRKSGTYYYGCEELKVEEVEDVNLVKEEGVGFEKKQEAGGKKKKKKGFEKKKEAFEKKQEEAGGVKGFEKKEAFEKGGVKKKQEAGGKKKKNKKKKNK